jgi:DUF218 domain
MTIEPAEHDHIMRYLDLHAEPVEADLAFVFGTRLPQPAELAVRLYQTGLVPLIVLTGGRNRLTNQIEAHDHRDMLTDAGVPLEQIIVEDQSTNTLENVRFALPLLAAKRDLTTIGRILVIAKWYHARRAMMTLKRHLPHGIRYFPISYEPAGSSRSDWQATEEGRQHVLGNWHAIPTYLAQGHLAEIFPEGSAFM